MRALAVILVFLAVTYQDLVQLKSFSLQNQEDRLALKMGIYLVILCFTVVGLDQLEQLFEAAFCPEKWNINQLLLSLPFNDLSVYFRYHNKVFLEIMKAIYQFGFYIPFIFLMLQAIAKRDHKMLTLLFFGTFGFHYLVHLPFYMFTEGHQVWLVKGMSEPLFRTISPLDHVFPSMHTSMSVSYILLARKQNSRLFSRFLTLFSSMVIFATVYLKIHWVVDLIAGAVIGWGAIRFAVYAYSKGWGKRFFTVDGKLSRSTKVTV